MSPYLAQVIAAHDAAWQAAFAANRANDGAPSMAELKALYAAAYHARTLMEILGFVEPYECGECDACQANAEARRADMQAAVDADPAFAADHHGRPLTADEEETAARLIADALGEDGDTPK